jgi:sensor c-di-GMP phosphodiesterase-like protein
MRLLQRRARIAVAASVFGTLAGALGGYLIGRATTLSQTETRLTQLASRSMDEGEAGTAESRRVLAEMNASRYQFCSDEEVAFFRTLIFQSRFLKDAGRLRDGAVDCSTTFGRITGPQQRWRADITQEDGTLLYRDPPMFRLGKQTIVAVQLGDSYIVYSPFNPKPQVSAPMHYVMVDVDAVTHTTDPLYGEMPPVVLTEDGLTRWNHTMFATRCSSDRVACMTMFESITHALQANHSSILFFALLGAIAGGLVGFVCAII